MSRRRKKNPLLGRIILISVLVHVISLPILARFGVFDKVKREFANATVVLVPEAKEEKDKPEAKVKKKANKETARKGAATRKAGDHKANPNAPKVVTAAPEPGVSGDSETAVDSGNGAAGVLPSTPPPPAEKKSAAPPAESRSPQPEPEPTPKPAPKPEIPKPKHVPVYVEAEQDYAPTPTIPDDLRQDALDKTYVAEFVVGPDGVPKEVKPVQTTGIAELDAIALKSARQWRFKPATLDGQGVESRVRLRIEFSVE